MASNSGATNEGLGPVKFGKPSFGPDFGHQEAKRGMMSAVTRADLAIGLQLLRASNVRSMRFQLALLRRDRRQTMEALDDLVELDEQIASFVQDMPPADVSLRELEDIGNWIDEQKRAISSEKLVVTRIAEGPGLRSVDDKRAAAPLDPGEESVAPDGEGSEKPELRRIVADIEQGAFEERARPATIADLTELDRLEGIEAAARDVRETVEKVDGRLDRLPGRGFIVITILLALVLLAAMIVFAGDLRTLIPDFAFQLRI